MGVIYTIACHDCKVKQDQDKWYEFRPVDTRAEAIIEHDAQKPNGSFRNILAVSFLYKHNGHRIEVRTDLDDDGWEAEKYPYDDPDYFSEPKHD